MEVAGFEPASSKNPLNSSYMFSLWFNFTFLPSHRQDEKKAILLAFRREGKGRLRSYPDTNRQFIPQAGQTAAPALIEAEDGCPCKSRSSKRYSGSCRSERETVFVCVCLVQGV